MSTIAVERHFSRAGAGYESSAGIQRTVARELVEHVGFARRVLEIGAGTGFATRALSAKLPSADITALDLSSGMLNVLREKLTGFQRIEVRCADFMATEIREKYDLVLSSSSLQWFENLEVAFSRIGALLEPGGRVLAAIMIRGTLSELRGLRADLFPGVLPKRGPPERAVVSEGLVRSGFRVKSLIERVYTEKAESAWSLFRRLQAAGLTGGDLSLGRRPLMRRELTRLAEAYEERFALLGGGVGASYRVLFVDASR